MINFACQTLIYILKMILAEYIRSSFTEKGYSFVNNLASLDTQIMLY